MKRIAMVTLGLVVSASSADAQNRRLFGAGSPLLEMTESMLELCEIPPANLVFVGGGNGMAGTMMANGTQQIAPMSRFLTSSECARPAPYDHGQGVVHSLDAVGLLSDDTEPTSCNTLRFQGDMPVPANANGNASLECPNCEDTNADGILDTYRFSEWQQALRIIYAGQHAPVNADACSADIPGTVGNSTVGNAQYSKFCESDVRHALVNTWGNMFEGGCADDECIALKHAFRGDDVSDSTGAFLTLLALPPVGAVPFCNGTEFEDEDPIRRACDGNGQSTGGENVCRRTTRVREGTNTNASPLVTIHGPVSAANAPPTRGVGDLGLVLPIITPDNEADQFTNNTPCAVLGFGGTFRYAPMPATLVGASQQLCPNGIGRVFDRCLWPVDANGEFGCANSAANRPAGVAGFANVMDGRVYNMTPRRRNGVIATAARLSGTTVVHRGLYNVGFYRLHQSTVQANASGTTCRKSNSSEQIGCLVHASPCSLGFASFTADQQDHNKLLALGTPRSVAEGGGAVSATPATVRRVLENCTTGAYAMRYPLSRKLYLNTLLGFDNVTDTAWTGGGTFVTKEAQLKKCWMDRRFVDRAATLSGFIPVSDSTCGSLPLPNPNEPLTTPVACDLSDRNPATEIELCPGVTYP